jgi:vacuolar-type H+-ATPase subunit F/Vma7
MNTVAAIGSDHVLEGFTLTGVRVVTAEGEAAIKAAWAGLEDSVGLVILSVEAAEVLADQLRDRPERLTVTLP